MDRTVLLLAEAMVALALCRVATLLPFRWMLAEDTLVADPPLDLTLRPAEARARAVARRIAAAQRLLPWPSSCLVVALAARALLRRRGMASVLRFGLRRDAAGRLAAHAWLEAGGGIVCGGPAAEGFVPLAGFARGRGT